MNHCQTTFGNRSLNSEITTKKESENSQQSKEFEAQSSRKLG